MTTPPDSRQWVESAIEAGALATFMVSAAAFTALLYHPASPVAAHIANEWLRRTLMGLAMGVTAMAIIYSPWGQRSGAHINPAVTLTFYRLGKMPRALAAAYVAAQFAGGFAGIAGVSFLLGGVVADPSVHYVITTPGPLGCAVAFAAEGVISFALMLTVLAVSNHPRFARFTGLCAGLLVWTFITVEAPLSGMSMNPARTLGSALAARDFTGLWIYFTAPPLGMLGAAELFVRRYGLRRIVCAKLRHPHAGTCLFNCGYAAAAKIARSA